MPANQPNAITKSVKSTSTKKKENPMYEDDTEKQPESFNFTFNPKDVDIETTSKQRASINTKVLQPSNKVVSTENVNQAIPFKDITSNHVSNNQLHPDTNLNLQARQGRHRLPPVNSAKENRPELNTQTGNNQT